MFGLGMPGCEQIKKMPEILEFTETIKATIEQIAAERNNKDANSYLKLNSFWSMVHGLVSINLMTSESKEEFNKMILKDFVKVFIKGLEP
jgi:hypothetical protein